MRGWKWRRGKLELRMKRKCHRHLCGFFEQQEFARVPPTEIHERGFFRAMLGAPTCMRAVEPRFFFFLFSRIKLSSTVPFFEALNGGPNLGQKNGLDQLLRILETGTPPTSRANPQPVLSARGNANASAPPRGRIAPGRTKAASSVNCGVETTGMPEPRKPLRTRSYAAGMERVGRGHTSTRLLGDFSFAILGTLHGRSLFLSLRGRDLRGPRPPFFNALARRGFFFFSPASSNNAETYLPAGP